MNKKLFAERGRITSLLLVVFFLLIEKQILKTLF